MSLVSGSSSLFTLIDAPARAALLRSRAGPLAVIAPAALGLALCAGATWVGGRLSDEPVMADRLLAAMVKSLALALPILLVGATWTRLKLAPSSTAATIGVALAVAGMCAAFMLPLLAFLKLCTADMTSVERMAAPLRAVVVPAVALLATGVVVTRALSAFDYVAGTRVGWAFGLVWFASFLFRVASITRGVGA